MEKKEEKRAKGMKITEITREGNKEIKGKKKKTKNEN
jgi:hypothetical protein